MNEGSYDVSVIGETGYRYAIRETGLMVRESRTQGVRHRFELRDARRRIDPTMSHWRGSWLLSAAEVFRSASCRAGVSPFRIITALPFLHRRHNAVYTYGREFLKDVEIGRVTRPA